MTKQLTDQDVRALRAAGKNAEIIAAKLSGRLDTYLGINNSPNTSDQLTAAEVTALSKAGRHSEIVRAKAEGRLDFYMQTNTTPSRINPNKGN